MQRISILLSLVLLLAVTAAEGAPKQQKAKRSSSPRVEKKVDTKISPSSEMLAPTTARENEISPFRWEFRTAPLALIARWFTLEALYHISEQLAVGPSYVKYGDAPVGSMFWLSYRGRAIGLVGTYYFDPLPATWYATFRYFHENYTFYPHARDKDEDHYKGHTIMGIAGYRVPLGKSFFLLAGGGLQFGKYELTETKTKAGIVTVTRDPSKFRALPYLELKVGAGF